MPKGRTELSDPAWLTRRYIDQKHTINEMARELNVTDGAVFAALKRHGVPTRSAAASRELRGTHSKVKRYPILGDRDWLERQYIKDGRSQGEIASEIGCTAGAVGKAMRTFGIATRPPTESTMMHRHPNLKNREWLRAEYVDKGRSSPEIALELGCTAQAVQHQLHMAGVKMRGRHYEHWNPKQCARCGNTFTPSGPAAQFCSERCRLGTRPCEQCGTDMLDTIHITKGIRYKRRFCSQDCRLTWMAANSSYRYGASGYVAVIRPGTLRRRTTAEGYALIHAGRGYSSTRPDGRILEHRLVMEEMLGRPLTRHETVHHINGDKTDNRPENLQLRQGRHGAGAHFVCGDCGSTNIVAAPI